MPISQPSSFINWDTNNENILPIPAGISENGWVPGQAIPAEYLNEIFQVLDLWTQFLFQQVSSNGGQTTITSGTTLTTTFASYFCNPTGGSFTVVLPSSSGVPGQIWRIKNIEFSGGHTVTVSLANAGNFLEGTVNGTITLADGQTLIVQSDGLGNYFEVPQNTAGAGIGQTGLFALTSSYTIALADDGKIFDCNTSSAAFPITLPAAIKNLKFRVVDAGGLFGSKPVTITRHGSESIGGLASNYICNAPYGVWDFACDGTNWQIVG